MPLREVLPSIALTWVTALVQIPARGMVVGSAVQGMRAKR